MLALVARCTAAPLLHRLPTDPAAGAQHNLAVTFRSADGGRWHAIGVGETIADAIEWARECCRGNVVWVADNWNDLNGD